MFLVAKAAAQQANEGVGYAPGSTNGAYVPQGEYPQGDYPQGDYPQGEYPQLSPPPSPAPPPPAPPPPPLPTVAIPELESLISLLSKITSVADYQKAANLANDLSQLQVLSQAGQGALLQGAIDQLCLPAGVKPPNLSGNPTAQALYNKYAATPVVNPLNYDAPVLDVRTAAQGVLQQQQSLFNGTLALAANQDLLQQARASGSAQGQPVAYWENVQAVAAEAILKQWQALHLSEYSLFGMLNNYFEEDGITEYDGYDQECVSPDCATVAAQLELFSNNKTYTTEGYAPTQVSELFTSPASAPASVALTMLAQFDHAYALCSRSPSKQNLLQLINVAQSNIFHPGEAYVLILPLAQAQLADDPVRLAGLVSTFINNSQYDTTSFFVPMFTTQTAILAQALAAEGLAQAQKTGTATDLEGRSQGVAYWQQLSISTTQTLRAACQAQRLAEASFIANIYPADQNGTGLDELHASFPANVTSLYNTNPSFTSAGPVTWLSGTSLTPQPPTNAPTIVTRLYADKQTSVGISADDWGQLVGYAAKNPQYKSGIAFLLNNLMDLQTGETLTTGAVQLQFLHDCQLYGTNEVALSLITIGQGSTGLVNVALAQNASAAVQSGEINLDDWLDAEMAAATLSPAVAQDLAASLRRSGYPTVTDSVASEPVLTNAAWGTAFRNPAFEPLVKLPIARSDLEMAFQLFDPNNTPGQNASQYAAGVAALLTVRLQGADGTAAYPANYAPLVSDGSPLNTNRWGDAVDTLAAVLSFSPSVNGTQAELTQWVAAHLGMIAGNL